MVQFKVFLLFLVSVLLLNDLVNAPEAEARRRRGLFGRRRPAAVRRNVNRNRGRNQQLAVRRNGNIDRDFFSRFAVDNNSSLIFDPTGNLGLASGLGLQPRFVRGRDGRIFEISGGAVLEDAQPVLFSRGQILGGTFRPLSAESEAQARIINQTGDLSLIPSVDSLSDPSSLR